MPSTTATPNAGKPYLTNYACGAAVAGRHDEALRYLGQAVDQGYDAPKWTAVDNDLKSLQGDPRFEALVAQAKARQGGRDED